jgi:hypothetical protein
MFYSKLRHAPSNSIIDISSRQYSKPSSKSSYNQNRAQSQPRTPSYFSHHQICHSYSNDSLDQEFIQNTKQTFNKIFHQTNFNEILNQIQCTLQPIVDQLRQQIQQKKYLSKQDRFICMKSCTKFIIETLLNDQWDIDHHFPEFYQLQQVLDRCLLKQRRDISTQTSEELERDMRQLKIDKKTDLELSSIQKPKKSSKISFISPDNLTRQKNYHKSVSRAFKKLNIDLQKMNHETPFQAHLSKYHKHNH